MGRKNARIWAMKLFYEMEMNENYCNDALDSFSKYHEIPKDELQYIELLYKNYIEHKEELDDRIRSYLSKWKLERIAKIDISILRIAVAEVLYLDDIPDSVAVNEAVEIAKEYSTSDAYKFINGVLGSVVRDKEKLDG